MAPAPTRAVRASASTETAFIGVRSIIRPPSQTAVPAMLWPPPRTASVSPLSRAKRTAWTTSLTSVQRTIIAGLRSIIAFQIVRASS